MAYLQKVKKIKEENSYEPKYSLNNGMSCGDGYKKGFSHRFTGTEKQTQVLIEITRKFQLSKVTDITSTSFIFTSKIEKHQEFMFRVCRLVRTPKMLEILEETLRLNKENKITIHNAFVLAHHIIFKKYNYHISYYVAGMDLIIMNSSFINFSFKRLKDLKEFIISKNFSYYQYIFYYDGGCYHTEHKTKSYNGTPFQDKNKRRLDFNSYLENKEYKKAEKLIGQRIF